MEIPYLQRACKMLLKDLSALSRSLLAKKLTSDLAVNKETAEWVASLQSDKHSIMEVSTVFEFFGAADYVAQRLAEQIESVDASGSLHHINLDFSKNKC